MFGAKEPLSGSELSNITTFFSNGDIVNGAKLVARELGLPIDIHIIIVPNDHKAQRYNTRFHSTALTRVYQGSSETEGITAQVLIPDSLPAYGASALINFPIEMKVSENIKMKPRVFVVLIAHELSHVLMYSMKHPNKENEFYTDLLAMLLGFQEVFSMGRKIIDVEFLKGAKITTTTTYGYLTDSQIGFDFQEIEELLIVGSKEKDDYVKKLKKYSDLLFEYDRVRLEFLKLIRFLSKDTNRRISAEDGQRIVDFFQPGYSDTQNNIHSNVRL